MEFNFICLNSALSYKSGSLILPKEFLQLYGQILPIQLFLHDPSDAIWSADFDKENGTIEGLHSMIYSYGVKKYNIPLLEYNGGPNFNIHIFTSYGVEMDDTFILVPSNKSIISELEDISQWNHASGGSQGKAKTIILKVTNRESLRLGEALLPRLFMLKYGTNLDNKVMLWMADRNIGIAGFCHKRNAIYGLERLFNRYNIGENCFLIFYYMGNSTFYLSILGQNGVNKLNGIEEAMGLKDVLIDKMVVQQSLEMLKSRDDEVAEVAAEVAEVVAEDTSTNFETKNLGTNEESFTVILTTSNVDNKCHGVYCPKAMKSFYRNWRNGKRVQLCYRGKEWQVTGNAAGKRCRFGRGWSQFVNDNSFVKGQQLIFQYDGTKERKFEIKVEL